MTAGVAPLTVLQLTDLHLFAQPHQDLLGLNTSASLQAVLKAVQSLSTQPDLILLTGDLAQDESAAAYQMINDIFGKFSIPIYPIPGNHDDPQLMSTILTTFPFQTERTFLERGWQFILLDSSVRSQVKGVLSAQTLESLSKTLGACTYPTAIALHHPAYPVQSHWLDDGLENYQKFWQVLDQYPHVQVVLSGHVHQAMTFARNGVQYLSTPSTCIQFKPRSHKFAVDERNPGFRLLTLFPDGSFQSWVERVFFPQQANLTSQGY